MIYCSVTVKPAIEVASSVMCRASTSLIWLAASYRRPSQLKEVPHSSYRRWKGTVLTHWGRVTHICVSKLIIIGSDNGLSPGRCQAIIRTNAGILLIGPLGTNFSEILSEIHTFSFKKMCLKMSSGKWRPFCLDLNVLRPTEGHCQHSLITVRWGWRWS